MYDFCVVGAGMVGSAAAKWLSMKQETKVCLIGPREPTEEEWISGSRDVFGSHYDEGRITRELDQMSVWGRLAQRSIQRYIDLEQRSGIKFYHEVGCVFIDKKGSDGIQKYLQCAQELGIQHELYGPEEFHSRFPYLHIRESGCECIWTPSNAGHISPRRLVAAQQQIAESNGCHVISQVVVKVTEEMTPDGQEEFVQVLCEDGTAVRAARVLLCTGAFTNFHSLLPENRKGDIRLSKVVVVRAELSEADACRLSSCPSISLENECLYGLPPIKYPDGKFYFKVGLRCSYENEIEDLSEASAWFNSRGRNYDNSQLIDSLKDLVPHLNPIGMSTDCCVVSSTPSGLPYCDMASSHVGVLVGMNGIGAKSSDELGRMGSLMISRELWEYDMPADLFKLQFKKSAENDKK